MVAPTISSSSNSGRRTLYSTPLAHSVSRDELEILPRALVCVDSSGIIEWIEKDCPGGSVQEAALRHGVVLGDESAGPGGSSGGVDIVDVPDGEFIAPGLIDTHTVGPQALQRIAVEADERSTLHSTPTSALGTSFSSLDGSTSSRSHKRPGAPTSNTPGRSITRWSSGTSTTGSDTSLLILAAFADMLQSTTVCYYASVHAESAAALADICHERGQSSR